VSFRGPFSVFFRGPCQSVSFRGPSRVLPCSSVARVHPWPVSGAAARRVSSNYTVFRAD